LSEDTARPIRLALDIADGALADRLAALLAGVPGLRLVAAGDPADAIIAQPTAPARRSDEDHAAYGATIDTTLTARELEVMALLAEGASNKLIARRLAISVHTAKGPFRRHGWTVYSGDMGNTFGPKGLLIGSSLHVSSSK
jgi:DNA-binding NarL/FixJ family response regulator